MTLRAFEVLRETADGTATLLGAWSARAMRSGSLLKHKLCSQTSATLADTAHITGAMATSSGEQEKYTQLTVNGSDSAIQGTP